MNGAGPAGESLSLRNLLRAAGIDPQIVSLWYLHGVPCESRGGTAPTFDQPLAEPAAGADPNIVVLVDAPVPTIPPAEYAPPATAAMSANLVQVFDEMEADWFACQVLEKQLLLARKQLTAALGRLAALDRDLSPEERFTATGKIRAIGRKCGGRSKMRRRNCRASSPLNYGLFTAAEAGSDGGQRFKPGRP